ncbi:uncharacterized protein PAC_16460 [Phialocephala subalpina]|uniref:Uncharacterized protein n=1 Tax=Phialocephala subalpina TaxID=576137 RepID=A0A1L7XNE7_9HELO|nr:uncharacterized protein PAC_16460 [Phialocephala subalpina]
MSGWANDEFMSNWDKTYVSTNLKDGAKAYDAALFKDLHSELSSNEELQKLSSEILVVASCALGRADLVGKWFDDQTKSSSAEESRKLFVRLRESIMCVYPFLGVPACMPACYGMIGVLERKGQAYGDTTRLRKPFMDEEDVEKGRKLRATIYSSAGNSGIFALMDKYFPDLYGASTAITWGYLISKANEEIFEMKESHLLVLTTICGLGATRQMGSHIKATIGIGNTVANVKTLISVVSRLAIWAEKPFKVPDVDALAEQVRQAAKV